MSRLFLGLAVASAFTLSAPAQSTFTYDVELIGGQEEPPNSSGGIGQAQVTIDPAQGRIAVTGRYSNLQGTASAAHIHGSARRGANSGVILGLTVSGGSAGTISGSGMLTASEVQTLMDGLAYLNLHSSAFPGGEIRGQIDHVPDSGSPSAPSPTVTGPATPGGTLNIGCPPSINIGIVLVGIGLPATVTLPLPAIIACVAPTNIGIDISLPFLNTGTGFVPLAIPPGVPSFELATQCAMLPLGGGCVDLSGAHRIAVRP